MDEEPSVVELGAQQPLTKRVLGTLHCRVHAFTCRDLFGLDYIVDLARANGEELERVFAVLGLARHTTRHMTDAGVLCNTRSCPTRWPARCIPVHTAHIRTHDACMHVSRIDIDASTSDKSLLCFAGREEHLTFLGRALNEQRHERMPEFLAQRLRRMEKELPGLQDKMNQALRDGNVNAVDDAELDIMMREKLEQIRASSLGAPDLLVE